MSGVMGPRKVREVRECSLGLTAKGLKPGERRRISTVVQAAFKGDRLVVAAHCLDATIHSLKVGSSEQIIGSIPAAIFGSVGCAAPLNLTPARPGQAISIEVERPNGGDFGAAVIGGAVVDSFEPEELDPLVDTAKAALTEIDEAYEPGVSLEELGW